MNVGGDIFDYGCNGEVIVLTKVLFWLSGSAPLLFSHFDP